MPVYRVLLLCLFFMGTFAIYRLSVQTSSKPQFLQLDRAGETDSNPIILPKPVRDLSVSLSRAGMDDSNSSRLDEISSLFEKINPRNDWLVFLGSRESKKIFKDLSSVGLRMLDEIPELGVVRFSIFDLQRALPVLQQFMEWESLSVNYPLRHPMPPRDEEAFEEIEFSGSFINWMGGKSDREGLGQGVQIALIDSGVNRSHPVLANTRVRQMNLPNQPQSGDVQVTNHGTALASVIAGQTDTYTGIAPGSEILSYAVTDKMGATDSFTVATAIVSAVQSGADIINLSLGGTEGSTVLQNAVSYALEHGVPLVAAVGNEGLGLVNYPAFYDGVIGVTAVGTNGRIANFSNFGKGVDVAAPGVGVLTASASENMAHFSGTSISTAIVTGAIAAELARRPDLTPREIEQLLKDFSNESETPGFDSIAGHGVLSLARLENKDNPNYTDAAFVGYHFENFAPINSGTLPFQAIVQNQGNTWLHGLTLELNYLGIGKKVRIDNLAPGDTRAEQLYLQGADIDGEVEISAEVNLPARVKDNRMDNNSRSSVLKF